MKQSSQIKKSADLHPVKWILGGLIAVTLYFQSTLADPFNSPKSWILLIVAAWLVGHIFSSRTLIFSQEPVKKVFYLAVFFVFFSLLSTLFADYWYSAVFGEVQRRNGFISYLSLSIILIATTIYIRLHNIKKLFFVTYFIATLFVVYAFLQTTGNDFVSWNNPYNSLIGTVGNPNFAAALMAVMGVIIFSTIFNNEFKLQLRIFGLIMAALLLIAIYRSNARQGLISFFLGTGIFLVIWLWGKNKKIGIIATLIGSGVFALSVLGMLQIGPFEKYLYKPSVSVRGYYWRAGIEMLTNHPLFGVGMDRYGAFFKQYRELEYPLKYGFELTSTNAHNTFIQLFATGGVFLGSAYLILNAYIFRRAIVGIKNLNGSNKLIMSGIFAAWVAFQSQSLVSIDNLGISIWGWILGGSIIGLSVSDEDKVNERQTKLLRKQNQINLSQAMVSGLATLVAVVLVFTFYKGETNYYQASQMVNLQDPTSRAFYKDLQIKVINTPLNDPSYKLFSAANLVQAGFVTEGLEEAQILYAENPRNLDTLLFLSLTYERLNKTSNAITYREKIVEFDPWNAVNYLALGKNYKATGDLVKSKAMLDKILSFASQTQTAVQAKIDLA